MRWEVGNFFVECQKGDITTQTDIEAIVNATNAALMPGGGVAGAIHHAAGIELSKACVPLAPIRAGEAVITEGFKLPNRWVIHCLGPVYGRDEPAAQLLMNCYRNALQLAEKHAIQSIAFPAISAGAFGYPLDEAAHVAAVAIKQVGPSLQRVKLVRFVLFDQASLRAFESAFEKTFMNCKP